MGNVSVVSDPNATSRSVAPAFFRSPQGGNPPWVRSVAPIDGSYALSYDPSMFNHLVEAIRSEVDEATERGALDKFARWERHDKRGGRNSFSSRLKKGTSRFARRQAQQGLRQALATGDTPDIPRRNTQGGAL